MKDRRARMRQGLMLAAFAAHLLRLPLAAAAPAAGQAEGIIAAVGVASLTVTTAGGSELRIALTADTVIIQRRAVTLAEIKPNELVGVTARREADGSLVAISINIFPPEFKARVREAQFMMESGNVMTNATVFQNVRRIEGRTLYLKLGEGTVVIAVPRDAEVIRLTVIRPGDLKSGMRVVVRGTTGADGGLVATTITVDAR